MERAVRLALVKASKTHPLPLHGHLVNVASKLAEQGKVIAVPCKNGPLRWYIPEERQPFDPTQPVFVDRGVPP